MLATAIRRKTATTCRRRTVKRPNFRQELHISHESCEQRRGVGEGTRQSRSYGQFDPADCDRRAGVFNDGGPEEVMQFVRSFRPMAGIGTLEDVANAAEYLAGDLAGFISGQHLLVSGGAPA